MVISLLRSFIKKLSNSCRNIWDSVSLKDHSAISDKTKSILFRVIVCCFNSQMSEIPDFSLCILRVHNLSDHERESRMLRGRSAPNGIIACLLTFFHWIHCLSSIHSFVEGLTIWFWNRMQFVHFSESLLYFFCCTSPHSFAPSLVIDSAFLTVLTVDQRFDLWSLPVASAGEGEWNAQRRFALETRCRRTRRAGGRRRG